MAKVHWRLPKFPDSSPTRRKFYYLDFSMMRGNSNLSEYLKFWPQLNRFYPYCYWTYLQQEYIPVGCVPSAAVAVSRGRGCLPREIVWLRGCLPRGLSTWGCLPGGVYPPGPIGRHPPGPRGRHPLRPSGRHPPTLWTEFLAHACENITFPQLLLRTVNILCKSKRWRWWPCHTERNISLSLFYK